MIVRKELQEAVDRLLAQRRETAHQELHTRMEGLYRHCPALAELFYQTVHAVNARDYSPEQLDAWADGRVELAAWDASFLAHRTLAAVEGDFTPSAFVRGITGVDNVCERAAVLASGGCIRIPKQAGGGVTFALALCPYAPDWRWQNG